jgi:hypothetical protein
MNIADTQAVAPVVILGATVAERPSHASKGRLMRVHITPPGIARFGRAFAAE